jgi:hypothetical protein
VKIRGLGESVVTGGSLVPAVTLNCSAANMFTFPFQGYLWTGWEIGNLAISFTGTTDVFHNMNFKNGYFHDLGITLTGTGSAAFTSSGTASVLNCEFERVAITTTNATRTVPMISLSSTGSGSVSNNTFWKCYFNNAGFDNTQPMVYIDCAGGANAYHYMETFRDCWFESCYGGAVKSLSGIALLIDGCTVWDIFTGSGGTVGKSCYYIGAFPSTGPGSQQSRILGCSRNQNGPNGSTTWDVECEASTAGTIIEGYSVKPDTASTATHCYIQLNGHPDAQIIGCVSPRGAAVNGNSTTIVSSPSSSTTVLGAGNTPGAASVELASQAGWTAADNGWLTWNFDLSLCPATFNALTGGTIYLQRLNLRRACSVTNVIIFVGTAGGTLTTAQNFGGLYNSAGTLVAATADQTTNWGSTGLKTMALAAGPFALQAGYYYLALVSNGTTPIAPARVQNSSGPLVNAGIGTAATKRWALNATAQTSLPGSLTLSSNTDGNLAIWSALS